MRFTEEETSILINLVDKRIQDTLNEFEESEFKNNKIYKDALIVKQKIQTDEKFTARQRSILKGIVNEYLTFGLKDIPNSVFEKTDVELLNLTEREYEDVELLDTIEKLYNKTHGNKGKIILTKDYFKDLLEIRRSNFTKVFYSNSFNKVYKIGIPINSTRVLYLDLDSNEHCLFNETTINQAPYSFEHFKQNQIVLELLIDYEKEYPLSNRMNFIKEILKEKL